MKRGFNIHCIDFKKRILFNTIEYVDSRDERFIYKSKDEIVEKLFSDGILELLEIQEDENFVRFWYRKGENFNQLLEVINSFIADIADEMDRILFEKALEKANGQGCEK